MDKMSKIKILSIKLSELSPNAGQIEGLPANPRFIRDEQYAKLVKSIQDDPEMLDLRELIVYPSESGYIVIAGNMRLRALRELKYKAAPCKVLDVTTPLKKLKAYAIKDNVPFGEHDWDALANEWDQDELAEWGLRVPGWDDPNGNGEDENDYSKKVEAPIYEPKNEKPDHGEVVDLSRTNELIEEIEKADIPQEDKDFLKLAANRHLVFNYEKIADIYAHSSPEVQRLMENSALVIIDFDRAIELGYTELSDKIAELYGEEYPKETAGRTTLLRSRCCATKATPERFTL